MAYVQFVIHVQRWRIVIVERSIHDQIQEAADAAIRSTCGEGPARWPSSSARDGAGGAERAAEPPPVPPARPAWGGGR